MHPVGEVYLELNGPDSTVVSGHTPWHETEVEIVVRGWDWGWLPPKGSVPGSLCKLSPQEAIHQSSSNNRQLRATLETNNHPHPR